MTEYAPNAGRDVSPVVHVGSVGSLEDLPSCWEEACRKSEQVSMFLGPVWLREFLNWFPDEQGTSARLLFSQDPREKSRMCMLPLMQNGRHLRSLSNYYTTVYGLFGNVRPNDVSEHVDALVNHIVNQTPRITTIRIQPMLQDEPEFHALVDALQQQKWAVEAFFCAGNWYLDNEFADFDEYLATRPGRLRNTIKRKWRKIEKSGASIEIHHDEKEVREHLGDYEAVYESSWKVREPYRDFIRGMVQEYAKEGAVRLGIVRLESQPIAAQIWIVRHGTAAIYKLAYDEYYKELSAGTVLSAALFRHAIEVDQVRRIDYLTGDDAYKSEWMTRRRELWGVIAHNPATVEGAVRAIVLQFRTLAKRYRSASTKARITL